MNISKYIDHTNINPEVTEQGIKKTCSEAKEYVFRGVCVNPEWVSLVSQELEGTNMKTIVLIDPPMGQSSSEDRIKMCEQAKKDGADELDVLINIIDIKYEKFDKVLNDLKDICSILPTKVIIGSGYLTDQEIKKSSELVKQAGAICVKTSTYKDPLDHFELLEKARHLKLMKDSAPDLLIKAAGKIRSYDDALMMINAGANIIGTSSSIRIYEEGQKKHEE